MLEDNKGHALLSASGSKQWLACTPSAKLCENIADKTSTYAEEGTAAHAFCENELDRLFGNKDGLSYSNQLASLKEDNAEFDTKEIMNHAETYRNFVATKLEEHKGPTLKLVEARVDFSEIVPQGFGTADCIIASEDKVTIIDFKYGKGVPVSAEDNPQLKLYAYGALKIVEMISEKPKVIELCIVQPRLDNIDIWETKLDALIDWAINYVKPRADLAIKGEGEQVPGDHCRFCKIKGLCRARAKQMLENNSNARPVYLLSNEELAECLNKSEGLAQWLEDIKSEAFNLIMNGEKIDGYKLVEGKSNRIIDTDKAFPVLIKNKVEEDMLYERKPLGITALEKLVGKKRLSELCDTFITKPSGKPTLVPASDKREEWSSAKDDFKEEV